MASEYVESGEDSSDGYRPKGGDGARTRPDSYLTATGRIYSPRPPCIRLRISRSPTVYDDDRVLPVVGWWIFRTDRRRCRKGATRILTTRPKRGDRAVSGVIVERPESTRDRSDENGTDRVTRLIRYSVSVKTACFDGTGAHVLDTVTHDSLDACLRLLSDRRRRRVIRQLRHEATGETTIDDLVDRLHSDGPSSDADRRTDREQLVIQLYHSILPALADHGVVEYDRRSGIVRYQPDEQVDAVLDSLPEETSVADL